VPDANAKLIRSLYEVFDDDVEAVVRHCADDVVFANPADAVDSGSRHGHDGARQWIKSLGGSFSAFNHEPVRIAAGDDSVAVDVHFTATGRESGVPLDHREGHLWSFRDGKIVRFEWFRDPEEPFRIAGAED
jgi:ketosteroid isomerase-like protein